MARPTIVLIPSWGSGHFMSAVEAGKKLLGGGGGAVSLTVLLMRAPEETKALEVEAHVRQEAATDLDIRFCQLPAFEHPTGFVSPVEFMSRYIQLYVLHVKAAIASLASPVAAIVVDLFLTTMIDVADELAVPAYVYFPSSAAFLTLMLRLPVLREDLMSVELEDMESTVDVPGLPPLPPSYLPTCLLKEKITSYNWFEYHGRRFMQARGIIVNTSVEIEAAVLAAIADGRCVPGRPAPAVHAIGPVIWFSPPAEQQPQECVQWLDKQPPASVVFICFGSIGSLDAAQVREVAAGLEHSGQRFLWVLRGAPTGDVRYPTDANLDELLPEGFLEATKGRGLVWPTWAPQKEILSHAGVGCFMTHCGWNSILESLWFGVPMVPWPLYGEQHLNAFELVVRVGAAVALKMDRKKGFFVKAAELERAVRGLMGGSAEGRKVRETAAATSAACRKAVGEGGSSHAALQRLVREILVLPDGGS